MHKKTLKRGVFNPLTPKAKVSQHLPKVKDYEDDDDSRNGQFQLPSIHRRKSWKDVDSSLSSCGYSAATSVSWPEEMEEVVTCKVFEQWDRIERTLFEEHDQLHSGPLLEECTQWKTQVPHLRVVGKNSIPSNTSSQQSQPEENSLLEKFDFCENDEIFSERTFSANSIQDSTKNRLHYVAQEEIFELLVEYINFELFPNKENETDKLNDNMTDALRVTPAPMYSDKSSKDSHVSKSRDKIRSGYHYEDRYSVTKNRILHEQDSLDSIQYELESKQNPSERKNGRSVSANKHVGGGNENNLSTLEEKINTPSLGRNKLGTVFNERIVVSPVPYILSTRESFCTLRTMPIKYIGQSFDISSKAVGSSRNVVSDLRTSSRRSGTTTVSSLHSAWQAPVCPTVWSKNVKLAPIDISRLPSSKNRTPAPSPATLHRHRKPLSPISRTAMPSSTYAHDDDARPLEIQGKHIVMGPSSKRNLRPAGWDYSPRVNTAAKKKVRAKSERQ